MDASLTDYRVTTTSAQRDIDDALLDTLESRALCYSLDMAHPLTGLVADRTMPDTVCSIATVGRALEAYPVRVERGLLSRDQAVARNLRVLRFFRDSPQGEAAEAPGYRGFYDHLFDVEMGRRAWHCDSMFACAAATGSSPPSPPRFRCRMTTQAAGRAPGSMASTEARSR